MYSVPVYWLFLARWAKIALAYVFVPLGFKPLVAGIKKNVHPHVMRASAITHHRGQGVSDAEIVRLTGQSLQMMNRYDKASLAENASRIALV